MHPRVNPAPVTSVEQQISQAGAYTRSHFRSSEADFVRHMTQSNPWMCQEGAQVEL